MVDFNAEFQSQSELVPQPKFEATTMGQQVDVPDFQMDYSALGPIMQPNAKIDFSQFQAPMPQKRVNTPEKEALQSPNSGDFNLNTIAANQSAQPMNGSMFSGSSTVSQRFGNPNAALYGKNSKGQANINRGTDIPLPKGSPQAAPPEGNWVVEKVASDGKWNTGWGNYVKMRNVDTGETIQLSHLDKVYVKPGQKVTGQAVGTTGRTGRTTGSHADIEYTVNGQLRDITTSRYRQYLGLQGGNSNGAKGGAVKDFANNVKTKLVNHWEKINTPEYIAKFNEDMYKPEAVMGVTSPIKASKQALKMITPQDRRIAGAFVEMYEKKGPKANFGKVGSDAQYLINALSEKLPIDTAMTNGKAAKLFNSLIEQADRLSRIKK